MTTVDLSKAVLYNTTFHYQILVSEGMTAQVLMDPMHQMNMDLVEGMDEWSAATCKEWNDNQTAVKKGEGGGRRRRRRRRGERARVLLVSTEPDSSIITNVTDAETTIQECCNGSLIEITVSEITQYQTYYLLLENYPDDVAAFVTSKFDEDVASGSYLNTIPEPSRNSNNLSSGEEEAESSPPAAAWKPTEPPLSPIVELPDDSGGAKTGAIAGGVTVALLVAIVGLFVARRQW
ncbi:LOW QUALITY PROTEIN: hypothetical protein ACHAWO_008089 [Cyclotella atomus]|uniref:Uncharacterized protein n=1 Tax=Cyclotella atomus TaxID=382360 RepID=A0ABD3PSD7_9STRA